MKTYEFYSAYPGGDFSTRREDYYGAPKSSRCRYEVRAKSIKQAYFVARKGEWSEGPGDPGLTWRKLGDAPAETAET